MKTYFKSAMYACLLAITLFFTACQNDGADDVVLNSDTTLEANSATAKLIERTASNDGSFDNIVDGSSCFNIRFPYTVMVDQIEITINSENDLQFIEQLFDAIDGDEDILDIIFPVTVVTADYSEITINGTDDLRDLAAQCVEGGDDDDIECIDFVYPITLFTFNTNSQQTGSVTVESDRQLRRFFAGLNPTDLIGIDFPVTFELYDGTKVTVDSYTELADAIERVKDACDEDDDDDYNDDDFTKERLDNLLVACPWWVKGIWRDNLDFISDYEQNLIEFQEDGTVTIQHAGTSFAGTWETEITDWRVVLALEFENLEDLNLEWFVYELEEGTIKLFKDGANRIILEKACDDGSTSCTDEDIATYLDECRWIVANVEQGEFLSNLTLDFSNMNIHVRNPNDTVVDEGNWEVENGTLTFNSLSMELANYIGEWEVIQCGRERFEIKRGDELLVLERICN